MAESTTQRNFPGPIATSCLTCKRRRKKCDQGRPTCERCIRGNFECLGYGHIRQRNAPGPRSIASQYGTVGGVVQALVYTNGENSDLGHDNRLPVETNLRPLDDPLYEQPGFTNYDVAGYIASTDDLLGLPCNTIPDLSLETQNNLWDIPLASFSDIPASSSRGARESHPSWPHISNPHGLNLLVGARAARTLSTLSPNTRQLIHYVFGQYERVLSSVFFKPKPSQAAKMRALVSTRLQASSITRCSGLFFAKIVESQLNGDAHDSRIEFARLLHRFEKRLCEAKARHINSLEYALEYEHLLNGLLEVAFMKIRVSKGYHVCQLLYDMAPIFFEIAHYDSSLRPDPNGPPIVCISKAITSTRLQLAHFALVDILCSMAYGLPQVVDYETTTLVPDGEIHPISWAHCCPLEFQVCIAEMNKRCAKSYVAPDWHIIEHRLLFYQAPVAATEGAESWKTVVQLAVMESWRQVLLIYLYMAVCGVSSDDVRVQSAVRQAFQLFKVGKNEGPLKIHFVFQYLIAGICAYSEKQRAYVRERLSSASDHERWLLPGCEFVPVLDHLWHGAAANGRSIRWSDYIESRQFALPIPV